ncbi:MAG: hypothetical protein IPH84_15615 [Bacteroidales bacterium]|nr:hypothetical protein [Bacteroidales bacterium]
MRISLTIILLTWVLLAAAQTLKDEELKNKTGTFEILNRTDYARSEDGFSKAIVTANFNRITELVNIVRKNPVLADIKGFNGRARIYTVLSDTKFGYGVPARISFEFSSFFKNKKGEVVFNSIEPPSWSVYINMVNPLGSGFSSDLFNRERCYFTVPLNKKTIQPGIDIYGDECIVLYDPLRPDYWIPVSVGEAFDAAKSELNKEKDPVASAYLKQYYDQEYGDIAAEDLEKAAYFGGGISRVSVAPGFEGQDSLFPRIMKVNPAYWNMNLPKSAIQFITLRSIQNKDYLNRKFEECQKTIDSGSGCDLARFEYSFNLDDVRRLLPLIGK